MPCLRHESESNLKPLLSWLPQRCMFLDSWEVYQRFYISSAFVDACFIHSFIHSFIADIFISPLQVGVLRSASNVFTQTRSFEFLVSIALLLLSSLLLLLH